MNWGTQLESPYLIADRISSYFFGSELWMQKSFRGSFQENIVREQAWIMGRQAEKIEIFCALSFYKVFWCENNPVEKSLIPIFQYAILEAKIQTERRKYICKRQNYYICIHSGVMPFDVSSFRLWLRSKTIFRWFIS